KADTSLAVARAPGRARLPDRTGWDVYRGCLEASAKARIRWRNPRLPLGQFLVVGRVIRIVAGAPGCRSGRLGLRSVARTRGVVLLIVATRQQPTQRRHHQDAARRPPTRLRLHP